MNQPFGIYLHYPFCKSKCPYCDFFSKVKKEIPQEAIVAGYLADLDYYAELTPNREVTSIFFGGGTPSLLSPTLIEKVIDHIAARWSLSDHVEISLEANPNSNQPHLFRELHAAGINRLSLGVQALNEPDLRFLGRTHSLAEALRAIEQVTQTFNNHSIDLIYARSDQQLSAWEAELQQAVNFGLRHISLYQLTIEPGTIFYKQGIKPLEDEAAAQMYEFTNQYLTQHGYPRYEVSNYAQNGFASRHNLLYWQGNDYLGIGEAAHGRLQLEGKNFATIHPRQFEELSASERTEELILMGLRLSEGIDKSHFKQICGLAFESVVNQKHFSQLVSQGLLTNSPSNLRATSQGFLVLNKLIEELCI